MSLHDGPQTRPKALPAFDVTGQTALITGSSRGIGAALARGLAEAGATVIVHGRSAARVAQTATAIADATGTTTHRATFDVTDSHAVDAAITEIETDIGAIDILVNNAGLQRRAPITEFTDSDWDDLVQTNLSGVFYMSRRVAQAMVPRGSGRIINIASVQSQLARPSIAPYSATKGGIAMLTKGLCADLGPHGIGVNAVAPGYIDTELNAALVADADFTAWVASRTPAGRWGTTEDLVGAVVFLASPAASFITGQTLYVDGGMTAVL